MKIYQVGGAVRDKLLGLEPHDIDYVVVGATPAQMRALNYQEVGRGFPVFLHPETKAEYALARREIKTGRKHTDFEFIFTPDVSLREDLKRRDFTCNALAYDEDTGEILDFFGGRQDIEQRVLRVVHPEHFVEDPLRVLRMCRFAAQLNFKPLPQTTDLCAQMVSRGMLADLTVERVWAEWLKAMQTPHFDVFIRLMREIGALQIFLPPIEDDVLVCLQRVSYLPTLVKFAVLAVGAKMSEDSVRAFCRHLKTPNEFQYFTIATVRHAADFETLQKLDGEGLYTLAAAMIIRHGNYVEEFMEVCRALYPKDAAFEQKAQILRVAVDVVQNTKATELPGFAQMPKDKQFKMNFRTYLINKIDRMILKIKTPH